MKTTIKPLAEFNQERRRIYGESFAPRPNGLACPACGAELWDSSDNGVFLSLPPKTQVTCPACGYLGYRVA